MFISHANPEDNNFVRWLGAKLSAMGYEVWADVMRLGGGVDWARELESALRKRSIKMLLVCTPVGLEKQGVRNEIEIAVNVARQLGDAEFIVPLRLEPFEAPFRIAQAQYIDFSGGWVSGLAELSELLVEKKVPRGNSGPMQTWLDAHATGSAKLAAKPEPLLSNWLQLASQPDQIHYSEPPSGLPLERFQDRTSHKWPVVPHRGGVISFAVPDEFGYMGLELPGKLQASLPTEEFLEEGWKTLGIDAYQARRMFSDLGAQGFDRLCASRELKAAVGSGNRASWWGDIKTAPIGKVRFDWGFRRGARQIVGQSAKRNVHWHYALNAQLRTAPVRHIRLSARLVFSDNGLDALTDHRRAHTLRRSLAKGWRNARWRDMLCAFLWWVTDERSEMKLPVSNGGFLSAHVPPMPFSCPVSVADGDEDFFDDDDPDIPEGAWEEGSEETEE